MRCASNDCTTSFRNVRIALQHIPRILSTPESRYCSLPTILPSVLLCTHLDKNALPQCSAHLETRTIRCCPCQSQPWGHSNAPPEDKGSKRTSSFCGRNGSSCHRNGRSSRCCLPYRAMSHREPCSDTAACIP